MCIFYYVSCYLPIKTNYPLKPLIYKQMQKREERNRMKNIRRIRLNGSKSFKISEYISQLNVFILTCIMQRGNTARLLILAEI